MKASVETMVPDRRGQLTPAERVEQRFRELRERYWRRLASGPHELMHGWRWRGRK